MSHNLIETVQAGSFEVASSWEAGIERTINLAFCRISSINSKAFSSIPNLYDLDLSGNRAVTIKTLTDLVKELASDAQNLDRLSLAHMNLSTLVPLFTPVTLLSLKFLNVSFNRISNIPANLFSTIRSLRVVDLSRNAVRTLGAGFSDLVNLRVLNISHNNLQSFQGAAVTQLSNVHTLDLSHNMLSNSSTVNVSPLTKLSHLDVSNNLLFSAVLPSNTSNLQFLDYHSNRITSFTGLNDASMLTVVDFSDNEMDSVSSYLFRGARFIRLANFSKNNIGRLDYQAFLHHSPLVIDLSHNLLRQMNYSNLAATQKLYLGHNELAHINIQTFQGMTSLQELDLSQNKLPALDKDLFEHLTNLKLLNLSHNRLDKVSWDYLFRSLDNLATLDLGHNNISDLSESMLQSLGSIQTISLRVNRLQRINPRVFRDVTRLKLIDLSDNPFDCVCDSLVFRDWLKRTKITILGLYAANSTAYNCRTPAHRAGIHVLHWSEDNFECHMSMLYLIIVFSTGAFFVIVAVVTSAVYRFCKKRRHSKAQKMKQRLLETEMTSKRTAKVDRVKLSNREIAEAIQEAIERKGRHQIYERLNRRNNYVPWLWDIRGPPQREVIIGRRGKEEDKERMIEKEIHVHKDGRRGEGSHYKRLKIDEVARDDLVIQHRKDSNVDRQQWRHEAVTAPNDYGIKRGKNAEIWNQGRLAKDSNSVPHFYDQQVAHTQILGRYEQGKDARVRNHERMFYYDRDPKQRHMVPNTRRAGPYIISSARIIPNKWDSASKWSGSQGWTNHGYVRPAGDDHRMDDYMAVPAGNSHLPRRDREGRGAERVIPLEAVVVDERVPTYYLRRPENDLDNEHTRRQRAQSYAYLPQDYSSYPRTDHTQRGYGTAKQGSRNSGIGPRAVSQPALATESIPGWL